MQNEGRYVIASAHGDVAFEAKRSHQLYFKGVCLSTKVVLDTLLTLPRCATPRRDGSVCLLHFESQSASIPFQVAGPETLQRLSVFVVQNDSAGSRAGPVRDVPLENR